MQEIIDQILEGNFDYENGSLDFSCAKLEINISAGEVVEGSFFIHATPGRLTRGYINSTDLRMECLTPDFTGNDEEIAYRFHGENMEEGEVVKGAFNVISNHGEYYLPFVVSVEHTVLDSSIGPIKNLFHFANLAKSNWQEAVTLFYNPLFSRIFIGGDMKLYDSYRGLSVHPGNEQNVEEFLIQINKKQKVEYLTEEEQLKLELGTVENSQNVQELELSVVRNGWGYTALNVECDGDFLFTEKELLTDDEFLGNRCRLPVFVEERLCREGKNFGQVVLYNSYVCITVPVVVKVGNTGKIGQVNLARRKLTVQLMERYLSFRMKKITSAVWEKETRKLVEKLVAMNENDVPARLFQAQLLISEERYNEASWLLDHAMSLMEQRESRDEVLQAYYLYLTTLIHRDEGYVKKVAAEVEQIYRHDNSQWRVAWLLLYLSEEYGRSPAAKWLFLEKQFYYGCSSPIIYMEALYLLGNNPTLLRRLNRFEMQVLYFGARKQSLTADLVEQFLYLAGKVRDYSDVLVHTMVLLYEKKADVRILQEICRLLIQGNKIGNAYFTWYQKGIEAQLRITNLYEYYMMSLDLSVPMELPKMVLLYFSYQSNLDYIHNAYLYEYVQRQKERFPELYGNYRMRIERFVVDQIQKLHINRNLASLYQKLLSPGMITEETAEPLSQLIFAHQVRVEDNRLRKVIVYQNGQLSPKEYVLQDGCTWVALYGNQYTILFEDGWGNRFAKSVEYTLEKLMMPGKFQRMILGFEHCAPEFDFYLCGTEHNEVTAENLARAVRVAASGEIAPQIRRDLLLKILQYYYDVDDMRSLDRYLEELPFEDLGQAERGKVLRYMVLRGKYVKAFYWLQQYGPYFVDVKVLVRLISEIMQKNNMVEDPLLTASALYAFRRGKYDSVVLTYLTMYFTGMTKDMRDIWKAAKSFDVDCYMLTEKIIIQMLYSGAFVGEKMDIFRYYVSQGAKQEVEEAFLMQCAYDYFVREKISDRYVFLEIRYAYQRGEAVAPVCRLAFLKYYAENVQEMEEDDKPLIEDFLGEFLRNGVHFNFFRDLKGFEYLTRVMEDKSIIEYRTRPGGKAKIHYVMMHDNGEADEYLTEYMRDVYGGVCFKEFVLFFGESLQYYITEEYEGQEQLTESGNLQKSDIVGQNHGCRYDMINDMIISKNLQDYDTLDRLLEEFYHKEYWNQQLFRLM